MKISQIFKFTCLWFFLVLPFTLHGQVETLTVMTYNMLFFPSNLFTRIEHFRRVLMEIEPDILVSQEITGQDGVIIMMRDILGAFSSDYEAGVFVDKGPENNAIFYKRSRVTLESYITIQTDLRDINGYIFSINNHADSTFRWTLFAAHFKAGNPDFSDVIPTESYRRWLEASALRSYIFDKDSTYYYAIAGDFNVYDAAEPAYTLLMDSMKVDLEDPIDVSGKWHNNSAFAEVHTQSTRTTQLSDDGSSGGLDDRFDFILLSHQLIGREYPLTYIEGSYTVYGNDGQHFNKNINDAPAIQGIPNDMADALYGASDHLPVFLRLAYPATGNSIGISGKLSLPERYALHQNFPNPFNSGTTLIYELTEASRVTLGVYDLAGVEVARLVDRRMDSGNHQAVWNGRNRWNRQAPTGIYIAKLMTPEGSQSIKMVLLK